MTDKAEIPKRIKFDYLKSNYHREILVEGAHGGLTPKGHLQMSVFNERRPIPKQTVHPVTEDGTIGLEILDERLSRDSIIRSVEATLLMDIPTAKIIYEWLRKHIEIADKLGSSQKMKDEK